MSFVHRLTVGWAADHERELPAHVRERAVRPPGWGSWEPAVVVPWSGSELADLQQVALDRNGLKVDLARLLDERGLLRLTYTGVVIHVAWPIAALAQELFSAAVLERGHRYLPERVAEEAAAHHAANVRTRALLALRDPRARLAAVVAGIDARELTGWLGVQVLSGDAHELVPELVELVGSRDPAREWFALQLLQRAGAAAGVAAPAIEALVARRRETSLAASALTTLSHLGPAGLPALRAALDDPRTRRSAVVALLRLGAVDAATRAKLAPIGEEPGELGELARRLL